MPHLPFPGAGAKVGSPYLFPAGAARANELPPDPVLNGRRLGSSPPPDERLAPGAPRQDGFSFPLFWHGQRPAERARAGVGSRAEVDYRGQGRYGILHLFIIESFGFFLDEESCCA